MPHPPRTGPSVAGAAWGVLILGLSGACTPDPVLGAVQPGAVRPGATVTLPVTDPPDAWTDAAWVGAGGQVVPASPTGTDTVTLTVPDDLASGDWSVRLGDQVAPGTVTVWRPRTEPPCDKRYSLRTETERRARRVTLTHTFADGTTERHAFVGEALVGLSLATTTTADGARCTALWLAVQGGERWLLADDVGEALPDRAERIAEALELPLARAGATGG